MKSISFFAAGTPKGQPRPRAFHAGGMTRVYDPGTAEGWKSEIAIAARNRIEKLEGPVMLDLFFQIDRPKNHRRANGKLKPDAPVFCSKKPDADNYAKAVMDALTYLGFWDDDCQVCVLSVSKKYANKGNSTGCRITITPLPNTFSPSDLITL